MLVSTEFQGQPCVELSLPAGDRVRIALHGAHVLSWNTADGTERLYLSPEALIDGRSPIRGGVPLCFPQFNQRSLGGVTLPKHGLARISTWAVLPAQEAATPGDGTAQQVRLGLQSDDATRSLWPGDFAATLTVHLASGHLRLAFDVTNTGEAPWPMALALHTYLKVDDIAATHLDGLGGATFWDGVRDLKAPDVRRQQPVGPLVFDAETDRVYEDVAGPLTVTHPGGALCITQSADLPDVVVWNPGEALSAALPDMPADGYRHMLCVEAARINTPVSLQPGQAWSAWQDFRVLG